MGVLVERSCELSLYRLQSGLSQLEYDEAHGVPNLVRQNRYKQRRARRIKIMVYP